MKEYLEYYQFHETNENGEVICLYCVVTNDEHGKIKLRFIKEYDSAIKELREFAYSNSLYTIDELKSSNMLHLQVSNENFRKMLKSKYNYNADDVDNFSNKVGTVEETKEKIEFGDIINNNPELVSPSILEENNDSPAEDYEIIDPSESELTSPYTFTENSNSSAETGNPSESAPVESEQESMESDEDDKLGIKEKILRKIKKLKSLKKIKKLAIRFTAITAAIFLGGVGLKNCSKSGQSNDFYVENTNNENSNTQNDDIYYYDEDVQQSYVPSNVSSNNYENVSTFQIYLNQSCKTTRDYMNNFKNNLSEFNDLARNYIDVSKKSRLGLDTDNYTAFQMALLGNEFGTYADNVSSYWSYEDLLNNYLKTNVQLKQLSTVQRQSSGFYKILETKEQQDFYQKYENMIIDLNSTTDDNEKIDKTESILSQIKQDFNMDSEDYNPEALVKSNSKYVAVMPLVRSVYERAKNRGYDNIPSSTKMKELSAACKNVAKENILDALTSINVKRSITPSYEMYTSEIESELKSKDLYVIDDERSIKDTNLYKSMKKLPRKVAEIEIVESQDNNIEESTPVYSTSDDNFEYYDDTNDITDVSTTTEETNSDEEITQTEENIDDSETVVEPTEEDNINDFALADQIIESDEGTVADNNNSIDDSATVEQPGNADNSDQIIESEEDIVNSMNGAINSGGYVEAPDGWQIDNSHLIDGTDIIDGSVSDITIEHAENVSNDSGELENDQTTYSENSTVEEIPVYDDTSNDTFNEDQTYSEVNDTFNTPEQAYDNSADVAAYQIDETAETEDTLPEEMAVKLSQEEAIDQVIAYNDNGINAIPVFNSTDNSWSVKIIDNTPVNEIEPVQYSI